MDCPTEERLIRMKLEILANIRFLEFDLQKRELVVCHLGSYEPIFHSLNSLDLNTSLLSSSNVDNFEPSITVANERQLLKKVLFINFAFFVIELLAGYIAHSMGLIADSFDMLADSIVYGLAFFAAGSTMLNKKRVAKISGYFQLLLAAAGLVEVIRRFVFNAEMPVFHIMIVVSLLALAANVASYYILKKSRSNEAHMQASIIFTSNDIVINIGVILAGVFVFVTGTKFPDLIIGAIVFFIVGRGALRILKLSK